MKKYLLLYAVLSTVLSAVLLRQHRTENKRLRQNQEALTGEVKHYRTQLGANAVSTQILRLHCNELEQLRAADAEAIRQLRIRLHRLEAVSKSTTATSIETSAPLHDSLIVRRQATRSVIDSVRTFHWSDPWVRIEGRLRNDSIHCRIRSVDTLRQVVHRIPRRFLFIRWGTKALHQEIVSSNPHTRIVYSEYIRIER